MKEILEQISYYLNQKQYSEALSNYKILFQNYPDYYHLDPTIDQSRLQHIKNTGNLARREFFESIKYLKDVSGRIALAIDSFVGIKKVSSSFPQKPSFFYIPDLPTKPFYEISDIEGLESVVGAIQANSAYLKSKTGSADTNYLDHFSHVPDQQEWNKLGDDNWHSIHFLQASGGDTVDDKGASKIKAILESPLIADCPPHAPEAFLSKLQPGAYIPPHFGLSNVKLTVQIPIEVNKDAWLKVADQKQSWQGNKILIFDDSLQHSAANNGKKARSVLIFDIWHPQLSGEERHAIAEFMQSHAIWSANFGVLATIDKGAYRS